MILILYDLNIISKKNRYYSDAKHPENIVVFRNLTLSVILVESRLDFLIEGPANSSLLSKESIVSPIAYLII